MYIVKPLANLVSLDAGTSANTIYLATCVYVSANGSKTDVAVNYANGDKKASFSMPNHTTLIVEKSSTDTITTSHIIEVTKIAFRG